MTTAITAALLAAFPGAEIVSTARPPLPSRRTGKATSDEAMSSSVRVLSATSSVGVTNIGNIGKEREQRLGLLAAARAQGCANPIRLTGSVQVTDGVTGTNIYSWSAEHDEASGVAYSPCKTRRAAKCPSCAALYQGDAYRLIVDGLRGGEFLAPTVSEHPALFVTFTAPSFGVVHSQRKTTSGQILACRPRRNGERCSHGADLTCGHRHSDNDPLLGQAIAPCCFDYAGAVLWNAHGGKLWRQTRINVDRALAKELGTTVTKMRKNLCRTQFVKIAEFQARGLVHFHTVVRLDGPDGSLSSVDGETLQRAIELAHESTTVEGIDHRRMGWGEQLDIKVIGADIERSKLAGYFAKYATKSSDAKGYLSSRIQRENQIPRLPVNDHLRRLIKTSWALAEQARTADLGKPPVVSRTGGMVRIVKDQGQWILTVTGGLAMNKRKRISRRFVTRDEAFAFLRTLERHPNPLRDLHLDAWAHQFGFGGHFLTKSQASELKDGTLWQGWSTTFKALRTRRSDHNAEVNRQTWQSQSPDAELVIVTSWAYAGLGYQSPEEARQAALLRARRHSQAPPTPAATAA